MPDLNAALMKTFFGLFSRIPTPAFRLLTRRNPKINQANMRLSAKAQVFCTIAEKVTPDANAIPVEALRAGFNQNLALLQDNHHQIHRVEDHVIPGSGDGVPVRIFAANARGAGPQPTLLFFHGGGYVVGDLDSYAPVCKALASLAQCTVISVHYRRAPEHKFPAPLEDAVHVYDYLQEHGAQWGVDTQNMAIGGDSAGGNLTAALSHALKAKGGTQPIFQVLIYPLTDATYSRPSHQEFAQGFQLTDEALEFYINAFLADRKTANNPKVSPLFEADFADLPPALVITAGFDPLRDEGQEYAEKLRAAGIPVAYRCYENMIHGFFSLSRVFPEGREVIEEIASALVGAFRHNTRP